MVFLELKLLQDWRKYGPNKLIEAKKRSAMLRFFDQMKDPMIIG